MGGSRFSVSAVWDWRRKMCSWDLLSNCYIKYRDGIILSDGRKNETNYYCGKGINAFYGLNVFGSELKA